MLIKLVFFTRSTAQIEAALFGLCKVALVQMQEAAREGRPLPSLYSSGVRLRYRRERAGKEDWLGPVDVLRLMHGDCEDLVAYWVGEQWYHGNLAWQPHCYAPRPGLVHCVARSASGTIEDPSKRLGMGGVG